MSKSKLRTLSMDFAVEIIELVKFLKSKHENVVPKELIPFAWKPVIV